MAKIGFSNNEIWGLFISTFTGTPDLTVTKIDDDEITFKASSIGPEGLFKSPEAIKARVTHAYSLNTKANPYLYLSGSKIIKELVDNDFLNDLGIDFEFKICSDDTQAQVMNCSISASSVYQLKRKVDSFNNLQIMLQSEEQVSSIMLGNNKRLKEDDFVGEVSDYGQEIININTDLMNKTAIVTINYGKIIADTHLASAKAPVLVALTNSTTEYTVSKKAVLTHAQAIIPSGVIYKDLGDGKLQPILFQSMRSDKPNNFQSSTFDFIVDVSTSMTHELPPIKREMKEIITKLIEITDDWTINITPFSHEVFPTQVFSSNSNYVQEVHSAISKLEVEFSTELYLAMESVYSKVISEVSATNNNVIITFTDGRDNHENSGRDAKVIALANELRAKSPQATMYNIGYQSYSQTYFDNLSKNTAAKTIHLDNINDLKDFYHEMNTINNCKVMYEFGSSHYAQCAAGDIFITPFTVAETTNVKVAGEMYDVGVENVQLTY